MADVAISALKPISTFADESPVEAKISKLLVAEGALQEHGEAAGLLIAQAPNPSQQARSTPFLQPLGATVVPIVFCNLRLAVWKIAILCRCGPMLPVNPGFEALLSTACLRCVSLCLLCLCLPRGFQTPHPPGADVMLAAVYAY